MTPAADTVFAPVPIAAAELAAQRGYLVRYARRKLNDPALAEDAVHDVFEAVLTGRAAFGGRSALRSWLTAVLKHKIVDLIRRQPLHDSLDDDGDGAEHDLAAADPRPDELIEQREALRRTLARIDTLPAGLRDAMRLRVLEERETGEVCAALSISEDNLFVRLHRARRQLLS